ncbi:MAG: peptide transporter [Clostridia bacterium]|nr:peptide transporter [Clostridia bacterium]
MQSLLRLTDHDARTIYDIFQLTDEVREGKYQDFLKGKSVILFFPSSSIRTRATFEKGIYLLGGQAILFPMETLDKKEDLRDVCGYLNNWADLVIVRHRDISLLQKMAACLSVPVINAMTDVNHPCEIIADLYALSKRRKDFTRDSFLFVGAKGNIGLAWKEAAAVMGFHLEQCCGQGYEMEGVVCHHNILDAATGKDIVCTDALPASALAAFKDCQVTTAAMERANEGALLNPCPPFYRGEEIADDVLDSKYFVGYSFKKHLLEVQQALMIYCLTH